MTQVFGQIWGIDKINVVNNVLMVKQILYVICV